MRLTDIKSETHDLKVEFASGTLAVSYYPNIYTADMADQMTKAMADPETQGEAFIAMVLGMLADWDLEDDDGKVLPLDPKSVRELVPVGVFGRIFQAVQEDLSPGEANATSKGGSSRKAR